MTKRGRPKAGIDTEMALALLAHTSIKVGVVAAACGVSRETLTRHIRKETGLTPLKYRQTKWGESGRKRKTTNVKPRTIEKLEAIKGDLRTTRLSIAQIAEKYGYASGPSLGSHFAEQTGQSCTQYREEAWKKHEEPPETKKIEIELAKEFLATKGWPIEKVALRSGHKSFAYFGKKFRAVVGVTPTQYREEEFRKQDRSTNWRVEKAKRLLETTNLLPKNISQQCGFKPKSDTTVSLRRAFENDNLPSPQVYRMQFHLAAIQTDLADPSQNIRDISNKYGFGNVRTNYFSRYFKTLTGMKPQEYRDQVGEAKLAGVIAGIIAAKSVAEPAVA